MLDRTLLCAPLLVPAFLFLAAVPGRREASPAADAAVTARAEAPLAVTVTTAPSTDPAQAPVPVSRDQRCTGERKHALPGAVTSTT